MHHQKPKASWLDNWGYTALCILNCLLCLSLVFPCIAVCCVVGHSMDPTLNDGQRYVVVRADNVQRQDIVVTHSTLLDTHIVKRVIAVPGDTLEIRDNVLYINAQAQNEPYLPEQMKTGDIGPFTLGEGKYFLMGDNRNFSGDSRHYGLFTQQEIRYVIPPNQLIWWLAAVAIVPVIVFVTLKLTDAEVFLLVFYKALRRTKPIPSSANNLDSTIKGGIV